MEGADWQTERCAECAFDPTSYGAHDLPDAMAKLGKRYRAPLTRLLPGEDAGLLRAHPIAGTWSALSYACHVRDVLAVFDERIRRMLAEENPSLGWWDHEAAVEDDAYDAQDPSEVVVALDANAASLSATLAGVPAGAWERTGVRGEGEVFTVLGVARYTLHEGHHHLLDVGRVLRAARGR